jgi:hypothetical protein
VLQGIEELEIPTVVKGKPVEEWCPTDPDKPDDPSCVFFTFGNAGLFDFLGGPHAIRISFARFDLDSDGTDEPCSGNAAVTPICIRFWIGTPKDPEQKIVPADQSYVPFVAGIFEKPPIYGSDPTVPVDIGVGSFRINIDDFMGWGFQVRFKYNYVQGNETQRESWPPRESRDVNHFFRAKRQYTAPLSDEMCGTGCLEFRYHSDIIQQGPRKVSQAAADSSRFAFEELVSSSPCFAGKADECNCDGGGTITVDKNENFTLNGCIGSSGQVFSGTITPGSNETYNATMSAFGNCTDVSWNNAKLDQACSGEASGTCAGESWTCSLSLDSSSGVCNASCEGDQLPILKSINFYTGPIKGKNTLPNDICQFAAWSEGLSDFSTCETQTGYIGKYVEDGGYWSGASAYNILIDGNPVVDIGYDDLYPCAIIPLDAPCYRDDVDATPPSPLDTNCNVPEEKCYKVGGLEDNIFVDEIPYVSMTTADDVMFPPESVFPLAPPPF